ncbi:MAG: stress response translation initiation inhibitor YciH [Candidatus Diapherotrites archaeon]|uniref:Protein translation factor SUI1 homolog n=1 Tax=Candidatus Iainarchaeum sp. TaxID=3101447 RepID=A0A8T4C5N0_9ARCH|nr:stress response translation initiation inhibitor YciH [Candidatus Diapherotrites archaeon]
METVCATCGLPKNICVCGQIAKETQKITIRTEQRRFKKYITIVEGLEESIAKEVAKTLKSKLACGGTIENGRIELQGNHKKEVKKILIQEGFKENSIHD